MPQHAWRSQKITAKYFSPSTMWVSVIEFRLSGLIASILPSELSSDPSIRHVLIADLLICYLTKLYPMKNEIISVSSSNSWMRTSEETNCAFRCLTASLSMSVCVSDWYRMTSRVCCPQTLDSCDLCTFSLPLHCKRTLSGLLMGFLRLFTPLLFTPRSLNTEIPSCD